MGPLLRKTRVSLVVETLEDRRLLSHPGPPASWDGPALDGPGHADLAPPILGPLSASADNANPPGPGSKDQAAPLPAPESIPDVPIVKDPGNNGPSTSPLAVPEGDDNPPPAPSIVNDPVNHDLSTLPTSAPPGNDSPPPPQSSVNDPDIHDPSTSPISAPPGNENPSPPQSGRGLDQGPDSTGEASVVATPPASIAALPASSQPNEAVDVLDARGAVGGPSIVESNLLPPPEASAHAWGSGPSAHENVSASFVPPAHVANGSSAHSENTEPSTSDESSLSVVGSLPIDADRAPANSPRGSATSDVMSGLGSTSASARIVLDIASAKGVTEGRLLKETPRTSIEEPEGTEDWPGDENLARSQAGDELDRPDPQLADMIMRLMPFDRSALEGIVDRFLEPLDGLSSSMLGSHGPMNLLTVSLTLAVTVLTVDVSLRIRRSREEERERDGDEEFIGFPGLPGIGRGSIS